MDLQFLGLINVTLQKSWMIKRWYILNINIWCWLDKCDKLHRNISEINTGSSFTAAKSENKLNWFKNLNVDFDFKADKVDKFNRNYSKMFFLIFTSTAEAPKINWSISKIKYLFWCHSSHVWLKSWTFSELNFWFWQHSSQVWKNT